MSDIFVYRLLRNARIPCAFSERDGEGAIRVGGRWNSIGVPMVYTTDHIATAGWEISQKVVWDSSQEQNKSLREYFIGILSEQFSYCRVAIIAEAVVSVEDFTGQSLPIDWDTKLPGGFYRPEIQAIGDRWIKSKTSLALRVPCAITRRHAFNYLLNPLHPEYPTLLEKREGFWRFDGDPFIPKTD